MKKHLIVRINNFGQLKPIGAGGGAPVARRSARAFMARTCISNAEIQSPASSRSFGNDTFRQPGINFPRTRAFFCTAGKLLRISGVVFFMNLLAEYFLTFLWCLCFQRQIGFERMARLQRVRPLAVAARTRSAEARTSRAAVGLLLRRSEWRSLEEQRRCSVREVQEGVRAKEFWCVIWRRLLLTEWRFECKDKESMMCE